MLYTIYNVHILHTRARAHTHTHNVLLSTPGAARAGRRAHANVSIRQHTLEYVSIRQHTSAYVSIPGEAPAGQRGHASPTAAAADTEQPSGSPPTVPPSRALQHRCSEYVSRICAPYRICQPYMRPIRALIYVSRKSARYRITPMHASRISAV